MKQTTAPQTPSPKKRVEQPDPKREFLVAAMNMSWQLAIVVLVPVIGGFKLDEKFDVLPAFTIAGFFIAMAGMAFIVWRQLQIFGPSAPRNHHKEAHS